MPFSRNSAFANVASCVDGLMQGVSNGCTMGQRCTSQTGLFSDTFYPQVCWRACICTRTCGHMRVRAHVGTCGHAGMRMLMRTHAYISVLHGHEPEHEQVLAYTNGLGPMVNTSKLRLHMQATAKKNCAFPDGKGGLVPDRCPNGLLTMTGRNGSGTDYELWQMINHDFAAIQLNLGVALDESLQFSRRSALSWAENVNDQWATAALSDARGFPTCINHYGYHMTSWHVVLAMSGQVARFHPPEAASLAFQPKLSAEAKGRDWSLPVLLPGRLGTIQRASSRYVLTLNLGEVALKSLSVDGCAAPAGVHVSPGHPFVWPVC